ncbi:M1 family metallopeptidase [Aureispira anguillae]|uniref:M1 family metallopeptidase n=1 Tax=Aureispira anguillae TaxID=2864201 RepID=A0A915YK47_9BACT|nr:M1 family metallopeptidase [Aureispira anguillae]BDS14401.1 M1 family metallopeptidase [Aureispira anguillae]
MTTLFLSIRNYFFISTLFLIISDLAAQEKAYFQQEVAYKIAVELDDIEHFLQGNIEIKYTNNSTDTLSYLYFHLWPNAYKHQQTDFAKQLLNQNRLDFHFSKKQDRGFIDQLAFTCNDEVINWEEDFEQPDIAKLNLPKAILPGETAVIKTPFRVKVAHNFSRLAHKDQAYMMCQWYPKPAVYDQDGWHPMPYLDQGEFYAEFGSFDVSITLPENYIVGATGTLETASEQKFLEERAEASKQINYEQVAFEADPFPPSSEKKKTIRYTANHVHDFAWFADKRYYVQKGEVQLASGKTVDTYAMFTKKEAYLWTEAIKYTNRALAFYSDIVGEYPYSSMTVVQGDYKGQDMEYPMVTVIGIAGYEEGLDNVITHEVGHNWFYGVLGSNERDHPWMDEGWNTYMDARYMSRYYGYNTGMEYLAYLYETKKYEDQPIESRSQDLSSINYYICGYAKPTMSFRYLQEYLGTEELDRILKIYFETWKFKHPSPADLRALFEKESTKDLSWFFDYVINTTQQIDYASTGHSCCNKHNKAEIRIENKGEIPAPVSLSALDEEGNVIEKIWVEPLERGQDTIIEMMSEPAVAYKIDAEKEMPEVNRNNNEIRVYSRFKKGEPVKIRLLADFRNPDQPRINVLPLLGFNLYDGVMIGAAVYNLPIPKPKWEYAIVPFFGTFSLAPVGMAELKHHSYIKRHRFSHGLSFKTFHKRLKRFSQDRPYKFKERFYKITPFVEFEFRKTSDLSKERHRFRFAHSFIFEEQGQETRENNGLFSYYNYLGKEVSWRSTHRLSHYYVNKQAQAPLNVLTTLEYANYNDIQEKQHYLKLTLEANFKIMYSRLWAVDLRIFTGGFLWHTDRDFGAMPLLLIAGNRHDYHYDDHVMGRREYDNALAQQISIREGGFKTAIEPIQYAGATNTFLFAINIKSDIPIKLPFRTKFIKLKPFLDIGYHKITDVLVTNPSIADEIMVSGGLMIDLWDGAGGIYLPLFGTDNIENKIKSFVGKEFYRRITFSFNLSRIRPEKVVEELGF